jgi:hypothetical protein
MFLAQSFRVWNARVWNTMGLERFRKEVSWPAIEPLDSTICGNIPTPTRHPRESKV